jgi:hypothetical protein
MSIRNINNNVYLFDIDDQFDPTKGSKQLSMSCVDNNIYLTVVNRTESNKSINYEILQELGFDIPTFIKGLNTVFAASDYEIIIDIVEKQETVHNPITGNVLSLLSQMVEKENSTDQ